MFSPGATPSPDEAGLSETPSDFDALVRDVLEHPENLLNSKLTSEQVLEIQKRLNPYAGIAGPALAADRKRIAAVSCTNLREDYLRRLTATSLVGFLFQVFHEWEVPVEQRRWTPPKALQKKDDPSHQPFEIEAIIERLEATLAIAREAAAASGEAGATKRAAIEADTILLDGESRAAVEQRYAEAEALAAKAGAGANSAITQYFYNVDAYFRLVDEAQAMGLTLPIVPGILPIINSAQLIRFSDACGAEIPRWLRLRLHAFDDDSAAIRAFGLDVVTDLCKRLLAGGAPGMHFYTMNQSAPTLEICRRLGLLPSGSAAGNGQSADQRTLAEAGT